MGDGLSKPYNVRKELSTIWHMVWFRTWETVTFVIHLPHSLPGNLRAKIVALVFLHCSSKAWYSSRHKGREDKGQWPG